MLKRDFILVQIEELGKVIAQLIHSRNTNAARKIPELIQIAYKSLKVESEDLLDKSPEELLKHFNSNDNGGIQRMEIAVKTLIEESYLYPDKQVSMLNRAKELLIFLQKTDTTFSLERVALLENIDTLLSGLQE